MTQRSGSSKPYSRRAQLRHFADIATDLGFPESSIVGIGLALVASSLLYVIRRTSVVGAILLTGYLGGAVATHVPVGAGAFNVGFPVAFGIVVWAGLWLRDERVRRAVGIL